MATTLYYRIQPAGLGLNHRSTTSADEQADGLHVFCNAVEVCSPDVRPERYGNEVVVLRAEEHWDNGDVEGVCVDGSSAEVLARVPLSDWLDIWEACDEDQSAFERELTVNGWFDADVEGAETRGE